MILYNIPGRTALNMPPDLLAELAQIDGIEAVKQANADELAADRRARPLRRQRRHPRARCSDMGGAGGISSPPTSSATRCAAWSTSPSTARRSTPSLRDVYEALFMHREPDRPSRRRCNLLGHDVGGLRLPLVEADEARARG